MSDGGIKNWLVKIYIYWQNKMGPSSAQLVMIYMGTTCTLAVEAVRPSSEIKAARVEKETKEDEGLN